MKTTISGINSAFLANIQIQDSANATRLQKFGEASIRAGLFMARYKPVLGIALNLLFLLAVSAFPAFAAAPNPWGGSGVTKVSNAGSNLLVFLTWLAFIFGIVSFITIPIYIKLDKGYWKPLACGITGVGGFAIIGSIAYDLVNVSTINMPDPSMGN